MKTRLDLIELHRRAFRAWIDAYKADLALSGFPPSWVWRLVLGIHLATYEHDTERHYLPQRERHGAGGSHWN